MHRRSFLALVASLLPASWLAVKKQKADECRTITVHSEYYDENGNLITQHVGTWQYDHEFWRTMNDGFHKSMLKGYEPLQASVWRAV